MTSLFDPKSDAVAWFDPSSGITHLNQDDAPRGAQAWPLTARELVRAQCGANVKAYQEKVKAYQEKVKAYQEKVERVAAEIKEPLDASFFAPEHLASAVMTPAETATADAGLCPKCLIPFDVKRREPIEGGGELWSAHCRNCDSTYILD